VSRSSTPSAPRREGVETAARGTHAAPLVTAGPDESLRRFVLAVAGAFVVLFGLVGAANAVVDPYGTVGTGAFPTLVFSDHRIKVALIARLETAPQVVVLGSSRALKIEPSWIQHRTGLTGFNAASAGARTEEAWGYVNLLHDRFPHVHTRYLWLVEPELFRRGRTNPLLLDNPTLGRYYGSGAKGASKLADVRQLFSWNALRDSYKVVRAELRDIKPDAFASFAPDGFRVSDRHDRLLSQGRKLSDELVKGIRDWRSSARLNFGPAPGDLAAGPRASFERTLRLMNGWGDAPVVVLSPMHPAYRRALGPAGIGHMHDVLLAYLHGLQRRGFRLTVLDMSDIRSFGGDPNAFYDPIHPTVPNVRRMLDAVIARTHGALQ